MELDGAIPAAAMSPGRTIGAGLGVLLVTALASMLTMTVGGALVSSGDPAAAPGDADLGLFAAGMIAGSACGGALLAWILRARSPRWYLAIARPQGRAVAIGLAAVVVAVVVLDGLRLAVRGEIVRGDWIEAFRAAPAIVLPLIALALVVVAPIYEEAYFRGFLHRGLAASRIGAAGAIAVTSVLFVLAHFPSDPIDVIEGLVFAVMLGVARERSGTIVVPIAMHALLNAQAIVVTAILARA